MTTDLAIDGHKLHLHPRRVAWWQQAHEKDSWFHAKHTRPLYVEVSPVGACNHRCTFCAVDYIGYKARVIPGKLLRDRLYEMGEYGVKSVMFAGEGEPLLHKEINSAVMVASEKMDVAFTTNGVLLDKLQMLDMCTWVKVSVNAGTKETYDRIHKGTDRDFEKVWKNIAGAVKRKGKCTIGVQMVVLPENETEARLLYQRAVDAGVDYVVLKPYSQHKKSITTQYQDFRASQPDFLEDPRTKLYVRDDAPSHEAQSYKVCHATPNFWAYIMADGSVYSCSAYLLDDRFRLGCIAENSFRAIWEGDLRRRNWEYVRSELDITECRKNCRMHKANEYLDQVANPVAHVNFI